MERLKLFVLNETGHSFNKDFSDSHFLNTHAPFVPYNASSLEVSLDMKLVLLELGERLEQTCLLRIADWVRTERKGEKTGFDVKIGMEFGITGRMTTNSTKSF